MHRASVELPFESPIYNKERLIISANPAQDSMDIAKENHLGHYSVGSIPDPHLRFFVPTKEMGSLALLALDRAPKNSQ